MKKRLLIPLFCLFSLVVSVQAGLAVTDTPLEKAVQILQHHE